jgi:hypothetical protein
MAQLTMCSSMGAIRRSLSVDVAFVSQCTTRALSSSAARLDEKPSNAPPTSPGTLLIRPETLATTSLTPLQLQQTSILAALDPRRLSSKSRPSKPAASNPAAWHEATSQAVRWPVEVLESRHPLRLEPHLPPLGREMPVPPVHAWPNSPPDQQPLTALRPPMAAKWCAPQEHSEYPAMQL